MERTERPVRRSLSVVSVLSVLSVFSVTKNERPVQWTGRSFERW